MSRRGDVRSVARAPSSRRDVNVRPLGAVAPRVSRTRAEEDDDGRDREGHADPRPVERGVGLEEVGPGDALGDGELRDSLANQTPDAMGILP